MRLLLPPTWTSLRAPFRRLGSHSGVVESVIGLEIHAQLQTRSKLFSGAAVDSSAPCNSTVALFDAGIPGTLPRLNRRAVELALAAAVALNADIQPWCRFDRKHYFYPDMPLGYQITQNDHPIARGGFFEFWPGGRGDELLPARRCGLRQIQIEMDSGKTLRVDDDQLYIDLNRAGVGLIEVVTDPDLSSPHEAATFVDQLRLLLAHHGICAGELHKGNLRVDANVSLRIAGRDYPRTELKNINSIRALRTAIEREIKRQSRLLKSGQEIRTVTLTVDEAGNIEVTREKGDFLDYRFTPEPNLPRLGIEDSWIDQARTQVEVKGPPDYRRLAVDFGIVPSLAIDISKDAERLAFVEATLPHLKAVPRDVYFDWMRQLQFASDHVKAKFPPSRDSPVTNAFPSIVSAVTSQKLTRLCAIDLLKRYLTDPHLSASVDEVAKQENLSRLMPDSLEFKNIVSKVVESNEKVIAKLGDTKPGQKAAAKLRNLIVAASAKRISIEDAELAVRVIQRNRIA